MEAHEPEVPTELQVGDEHPNPVRDVLTSKYHIPWEPKLPEPIDNKEANTSMEPEVLWPNITTCVSVETVELFSLQNIRLLIDKLSFTTVNITRSENKSSIAATFMYLGTSKCMLWSQSMLRVSYVTLQLTYGG